MTLVLPPSAPHGAPAGIAPGAGISGPGQREDPAEKRRRQTEQRAVRAAARAAARAVAPERRPEFAHLDLESLRVYRKALLEEEDRVSYWRRILQARLDVVRAGTDRHDRDQIKPMLDHRKMTGGRNALVNILPDSDAPPPLPNLERLWGTTAEPGDHHALGALEAELTKAEVELSEYRSDLHGRLDGATTELIARYREDPLQCLVALPLP